MKIVLNRVKMNSNQSKPKFNNVSHLRINNEKTHTIQISHQQQPVQQPQQQKAVIERGASWSFSETKILLSLWSQDVIQRQLTNSKRTRHVWEKIAEKIKEFGYNRTPDQVRTRVFNMIAEYRRIKRNPTEEKIKKCTFFYSLQEVLEPNLSGIRTAINRNEDEYQIEFNNNDENDENFSNNELVMDNSREPSELDDKEVFLYSMSPSYLNQSFNSTQSVNQSNRYNQNERFKLSNYESNNQSLNTSCNSNFNQLNMFSQSDLNFKKNNKQNQNSQQNSSRTDSLNGIDSDHSQNSFSELQYSNYLNKKRQSNETLNFQNKKRTKLNNDYDESDNSNVITIELIERLIYHLAKSNESMLEWIKLEQGRLEFEKIRKKEDDAREEKKERQFLEALLTIQNSIFNFLKNQSNDTIDDYTMKLREKLNLIKENTDKHEEQNNKNESIDNQKTSNDEQNLNEHQYSDHQNLCQQRDSEEINIENNLNRNTINKELTKEQKVKIINNGNSLLATNSNKNRQTVIETVTRINQQNEKLENKEDQQSGQLQNQQHNYCRDSNVEQEDEELEDDLEYEIINQEEIIDNTYDNFNLANVQHEEIVD